MQTKKLFLFRVFFPSWKLFEDAGEVPVLFCKSLSQEKWSEWEEVVPRVSRSWTHLFLNPQINLYHVMRSSIDHLMGDIGASHSIKSHDIENMTSYLVVKNMAQWKLKGTDYQSFQFKISGRNLLKQSETEDILISPVYNKGDW